MSKVAVIGAGIFGCMAALRLHDAGFQVTLLERSSYILNGASRNNQHRLHLGYHYPRSPETIDQCKIGFEAFSKEFPGCLSEGVSHYFVMGPDMGGVTSVEAFEHTFRDRGLPLECVNLATFEPRVANVLAGYRTPERVYDVTELRVELSRRLSMCDVDVQFSSDVRSISRLGGGGFLLDGKDPYDVVVNCTFGDINRLTAMLGHTVEAKRYEYTAILVLRLPIAPVGITIMDSPTNGVTLFPYGKTSQFLLYHTALSVLDSKEVTQLPKGWLDESPLQEMSKLSWADTILSKCETFLPILDRARPLGVLHGPRMVPANSDRFDERPSFVKSHERGYLTVHAGKIDHCIQSATDVTTTLKEQLG